MWIFKAGVIGGGFMGAEIAQVITYSGLPVVVAGILRLSNGNWAITFYTSAAIYFMGTFFWLALDPTKPIEAATDG